MREKFWELAGTKLGNLLKINKEVEKLENSNQPLGESLPEVTKSSGADDEVDYKADN